MAETIYLPSERNFYPKGTPVKSYFEGIITKGKLEAVDEDRHCVCLRLSDGKLHWTHESHVTLDRNKT